ncbi:thyroid transcription factor 1-associated protein 26-like [Zootermopsis nevadensis]|uniref:Thyroid transcription factor 1-associated protein 26 n=1 Tax=Zootermopsis nevadensis TaxID=136037 RepID=A0A067QXK5_ZOONE|nr:thyroid transcription factor 1-associated protein 26-like [Zootermopsis nevadensis]KDR14970.1 Thyroid transcription factor 1-associated protein 26 [Zootermopsis nevadensis]
MSANSEAHTEKKTNAFNKKEWRRRKYSNKYKVEQWEEHRRRAVLRSYHKELRRSASQSSVGKNHMSTSLICENKERLPRLTAYQKAEEDYKCKQEEKIAKLKEDQKKRQERSQAIARYQNNKAEVFKKLSKKTKKGQPVMKGRIEILLEKLQQDLQS